MKEINLKSRQNGETNRKIKGKIKGLTLTVGESVAEKTAGCLVTLSRWISYSHQYY